MRLTLLISIVFLICLSCKDEYYHVLHDSYSKKDTLIVYDYFLQIRDGDAIHTPQDVADSLMSYFYQRLETLNFPYRVIENGTNHANDYFFQVSRFTTGPRRLLDNTRILELVKPEHKHMTLIIPFIEIYNRFNSSYGGTTHIPFACAEITLVKDSKIIYRGFRRVPGPGVLAVYSWEHEQNVNSLDDWNRAIYGAFKGYITNLK
jgi:hypothetical protein